MKPDPTGLPIEDSLESLRVALADTGHAVLTAEPGAGKTTVVPLRLLDEPWLAGRRIVLLEPRRVAARAAARRMASLLGEEPGQTVGWVTRDDRRIGPDTRVEVVTEGVLTARLVHDPALRGVGLVIFDEFHERSLPGDTGLALALHSRRHHGLDARLLVMSATLDTDAVAALLGSPADPAPTVSSPGRTHPIEIFWRPKKRRDPLVPAVVHSVREALRAPEDVLVFLPGVGEIRRTEAALQAELGRDGPAILPLHGSLPAADQDAALVARADKRIVLATDLAETSLTVEGIGSVVDAGLARVPRYDTRTAMTALTTITASRASAEQRAGRAGRTGPGIAIRLWSKVEHASRVRFLAPEITQVELAGLVLELASREITDPAELTFLDPPPQKTWAEGVSLLQSIGALDSAAIVTPLGTELASIGTHPRLARAIATGRHRWLGCLLAALIDDRDVLRGRPSDLPADLAERVALVLDPDRHHPQADGRAIRQARDRAHDLARRHGIETGPVSLSDIGPALAAGFPDRIARAKPGIAGRFVLADGRTAKISRDDPLRSAAGLLAVDLGGRIKDPAINRAAVLEARIDHLVYATPDLDSTVATIAESWGVTPAPGGRHDGFGTRNALLGLGGGAYLELIGPDPGQPDPAGPRPFGVDEVTVPRLVTWAIRVPDIELWVRWARQRGVDPGDATAMQRTTPDGSVLKWKLTAPLPTEDGVLPFLIEWPGNTPAASAPGGVTLMNFSLTHNDPAIGTRLAEHAIAIRVESGAPGLAATLLTPNGVTELRS